jgi:diguanylate cyclase (GGDEF)-like protein
MRITFPAAAPLMSRPSLGDALGLVPTDDGDVETTRTLRLGEVAALWPMAMAALLLAPALLGGFALFSGDGALVVRAGLIGAPALTAALAGLAVLRLRAVGDWPSHGRVAALATCGVLAGVSLSLLLALSTEYTMPALRVAGFVAACGAIVVTVVALHAVRAASLAFAGALGLMVPVTTGFGIATAAALILVALLLVGVLSIARIDLDLSAERHEAEAEGRRASRLVAEFEAQGNGWFWQTDRGGAITYLSAKVAAELTAMGKPPLGERLVDVLRVDSGLSDTERTLLFHFSSRTSFSDYSVRVATEQPTDRWWSISGRPIVDELGRFQGFIGSGSDLTEKRRAEAEITRLALFDSLTGLANRQRMKLSLDQTLAPKTGGAGVTGLFLLDLDRFKAVNDTLGHQAGDNLLKQVAVRLQRAVGDAGLVGRLGGDEFQVVLPGEGNRETLGHIARSIITSLSQPYFIEGSSVSIGTSVGISIAPDHGGDAETLIRNADLALYAAKADGRGVHRFYREELLAGAQNRKRLEDDLRHALAHDQFHLAYQPVVATESERIVGYEALLRWDHPSRGAISPADFVPVAEECGLIEQIGEWVLRTAVREAASWPPHVRVAVNVSPIQFANPNLPALVTSAIAAAGIAPQRLELEITEGVFLNDSAQAEAMFKSLKGLGVRLALDDFGTGYSSLGYLKKAPFDKIKIDQSFVRGAIEPGSRNAAIIKAIVTLADTLYMETTAEGVEQQDEIALIRQLGCSHIQGFVYGRAARAEQVAEQLATGGGKATAIGYKVSRSARTTLLRSARMEIGPDAGEVRLRNISATGAMIDGVDLPEGLVGVDCLIELLEDELFTATIRWSDDGRAGLEFAESFNLERLNGSVAKPAPRRNAA